MGDTFEPHRRRAEKRLSPARMTLYIVVLTIVAAGILVLASGRLAQDRSAVAAFRAAPNCPSSTSAAVAARTDCKQVTPYTVTYADQQGSGSSWKAFIGVRSASGGQLNLQFALAGNEYGFADDGDPVTITSWHGVPIWISNSVLTAELVNPLLESGESPYLWLWYTAAVYVFLVLLVLVQHRLRLLLLAPAVVLIVGLGLHDRIVGGHWRQCVLYFGLAIIVLCYVGFFLGRFRMVRRLLRR
jgi:hypothetical protein